MNTKSLLEHLQAGIAQIENHTRISIELEVNERMLELHAEVIKHFKHLIAAVEKLQLSKNHTRYFIDNVNQTLGYFTYKGQPNLNFINVTNKEAYRGAVEINQRSIEEQLKKLQFNLNFFEKLGFFSNNVVAIGANGSGKTTLSNDVKKYLTERGIVISAQKILVVPTFHGISNYSITSPELENSQSADKSLKITYDTRYGGSVSGSLGHLGAEYKVLLDNLLAERSSKRNVFCDDYQKGESGGVPITRFDITLSIWNSIFTHRVMECKDGINITLKLNSTTDTYPAYLMSDGEKVGLYLIAQVIQAPQDGFIIVDEPEMYLHKTVLKKLWDRLEQERNDCIFIYLTHDLDFATSRVDAKKVWIKSFTPPDNWEMENIQENDIPESLLLELLGSRKDILFCEGERGGKDEKIYSVLFPDYTTIPVANCSTVIGYTKAFNSLPNTHAKAFGIIDSDHYGANRIAALGKENIFSVPLVEVENLLLDEDFLKLFAEKYDHDMSEISKIKDEVILKLKGELEPQISNYVTAKVNYYFNDSHVKKGNTLETLSLNYTKFTGEVKLEEWYAIRKAEIEQIVENKDYSKTLSVFNNKGLHAVANKYFKVKDYQEKAIKFLLTECKTHDVLRKHFPEEICPRTVSEGKHKQLKTAKKKPPL